jgi:hypothetical protein
MQNVLPKTLLALTGSIAFGIVGTEATWAAAINVVNPSFENPSLTFFSFTNNVAPGWVATGPPGFTSGIRNQSGLVPDGDNLAYFNAGGGLRQTLTTNLATDTTYELTVAVGNANVSFADSYVIELLAGNQVLSSLSSTEIGAIPQFTFVERTIEYTTSSTDPLVGQPLEIWFRHLGSSGQFQIDNVRLEANSRVVPTPALLPGLIGMGAAALRKRKQEAEAEA